MANSPSLIQGFIQDEDDSNDSSMVSMVDHHNDDDHLILQALFFQNTILKLLSNVRRQTRSTRIPSLFDQRMIWDVLLQKFRNCNDFRRHLRMSTVSFNILVSWISNDLDKMANLRGGAILPEICFYATIPYLAGGSYSDIKYFSGISFASFYRCLWRTL
jgi:hypothetical protein